MSKLVDYNQAGHAPRFGFPLGCHCQQVTYCFDPVCLEKTEMVCGCPIRFLTSLLFALIELITLFSINKIRQALLNAIADFKVEVEYVVFVRRKGVSDLRR